MDTLNYSNNLVENIFTKKDDFTPEKLILKILNNIESKKTSLEDYKSTFLHQNEYSDKIILTKFNFLEILNDFDEVITQSLQGMKTLLTEIRNLRDKNIINSNNSHKCIFSKKEINKEQNIQNNELIYDYNEIPDYNHFLKEKKNYRMNYNTYNINNNGNNIKNTIPHNSYFNYKKNLLNHKIESEKIKNYNSVSVIENKINCNSIIENSSKNNHNSYNKAFRLKINKNNHDLKNHDKIAIKIKNPLREDLREYCRHKNSRNKSNFTNQINFDKRRILKKIEKDEKLKSYFSEKYGQNSFAVFAEKFLKNKLNSNDIYNELLIMNEIKEREELLDYKYKKEFIQGKKYRKKLSDYGYKFLAKTPMQNSMFFKRKLDNNYDNRSHKAITPARSVLDNLSFKEESGFRTNKNYSQNSIYFY